MDWIHCNNCYVQPGDVEMKKFFITNCGHIYCGECLKMNQTKECKVCHVKYTTIPLTANMKAEIEVFFQDPATDLKKQVKILEFQQSHRRHFVSYLREKIKTYKALEKENYSLTKELSVFKQQNIALRDEIRRIKEDFISFKKKCEYSATCDQSTSSQILDTPRLHCYNQFLTKDSQWVTPKLRMASGSGKNDPTFTVSTKRSVASNCFFMSDSKSSSGINERIFVTPDKPKHLGSHRGHRVSTPDTNTPPTPESLIRDLRQGDPLQRKVKLPNSRSEPSPASKIGFHGLSLSKLTSTPKKETLNTNKYFKYVK